MTGEEFNKWAASLRGMDDYRVKARFKKGDGPLEPFARLIIEVAERHFELERKLEKGEL